MGDDWSDDEGSTAKPQVKASTKSNDDDWGDDNDQKANHQEAPSRGGFSGGRGGTNQSGDGSRPNRDDDWICSSCDQSNFASRRACFKCQVAKPGSSGANSAQTRDDDWICSSCDQSNFASRRACFKCQVAKPGSSGANSAPTRDDDWICSSCDQSNFASRRACFKCQVAKPESAEDENKEKKRELYVPPAPTENEDEMFGSGISAGINFDNFDKIEVKVSSVDGIVVPLVKTFEASGLRELLLENVKRSGYLTPTPIQKHAIPIIMAGRDLMGCAQTGSGKTAAFVLPILHAIMSDKEAIVGQPQCLIVAPTRELAIQIFDEARKFANRSFVKVAIAYGGTASRHQSENLNKGCHVLVATPGRLMDFVGKGLVTFESLKFLVLDEADRMLDMGFKQKIHEIAHHETLNKSQLQTLMFSATFPPEIQELASAYLRDYMFLVVGIIGSASTDVEQEVLEVTKFKKREQLSRIIKEYSDSPDEDRILVFVETKKTADFLASFMSETIKNISSTSIHGDREQREREEALRDFRSGKRKVLIATSVAARGLDIKGVTHVINYDLPKDIQDYVHRIGRTGRVGNKGKATSFFDPEYDSAVASDLARILSEAKQPIPEFLGEAGGSAGGSSAFGGVDVRSGVTAASKNVEEDNWD